MKSVKKMQWLAYCLLLVAFCFFLPAFISPLFAQEQKGNVVELDNDIMFSDNWFSDLEKAKQNPDKVLYLDLALRKLKTFPKEILTFKNVERLYLSVNYWSNIPDDIGTLSKLKIIDISSNYYLNYLPKEGLSGLKNLELLIIKDNKLAAGEIEKVKKLLPGTRVVTQD